jgi:hypothetical protein
MEKRTQKSGTSAAQLLAERDAARDELQQAVTVLNEVRAAFGCADGENVVDAARRIVAAANDRADNGLRAILAEALGIDPAASEEAMSRAIAQKASLADRAEAESDRADRMSQQAAAYSAERDRWRRRARTTYVLGQADALRWEILSRCMRTLEATTAAVGNLLRGIDAHQAPGRPMLVASVCSTCGEVEFTQCDDDHTRSGLRLCDRCLATEPDPWAAVDARAPSASYTPAGERTEEER